MPVSYSIQVGLTVYKALTARLEEGLSYDDVLRELLALDSVVEPEPDDPLGLRELGDGIQRALHAKSGKGGFFSRGLWLPNGTRLRARYKQRQFLAEICDGNWVDEHGHRHTSPSAAATAITRTNVNGLRFWEAMRPLDPAWRRLDALVEA
ncbi:MAG TPA: hypothetical protein VF759_12255 [Allosphingosinicella sp.]|jgi:hypothetical protein